jgi:hypothetical protein
MASENIYEHIRVLFVAGTAWAGCSVEPCSRKT